MAKCLINRTSCPMKCPSKYIILFIIYRLLDGVKLALNIDRHTLKKLIKLSIKQLNLKGGYHGLHTSCIGGSIIRNVSGD